MPVTSTTPSGGAARGHAVVCSVVVPVRDDAENLTRLLAALDRQTRPPDEVVVVDNASRDASARIALEWGARVVTETTVGIPFAAAAGYDAATGSILIRADADTLPDDQWVERLLSALEDNRDAVGVTGPGRFYGMPAAVAAAASFVYVGAYVAVTSLTLGHSPLFGTNLALRRSWWEAVRAGVHLDAAVHDDMDLSFRVKPHERVVFAHRIIVGMSPRPLASASAFRVRVRRGMATVRLNWREEAPWTRWADRWRVP